MIVIKSELENKIEQLFSKYDKPHGPGLAVGVILDGELIYAKGFGLANLEYDIPITSKTVFHVASMAKQFTAMSIALLEEQGALSLEDDIRLYFPQLPKYEQQLTIKNLVHMTNGLYDLYVLANYGMGVRENQEITKPMAWQNVQACYWQMFKPGEKFSYGNTGYFLLAELVEKITSQTLPEFAHKNIFAPLGMHQTFFRDDNTKIIVHRAESYSSFEHVHYNERVARHCTKGDETAINACNTALPGAGQLHTTIEDLYLWDCNFYHNILGKGSPALIQKTTTPGNLNDGQSCGYGYGLFISDKGGLKNVYHGGWANGYSSVMLQIPKKRTTVICLGNHTSYFEDLEVWSGSYSIPERIVELLHPDLSFTPPNSAKTPSRAPYLLDKDQTQHLIGRYYNPTTSYMWELSDKDGCLTVLENTWNKFELKPLGDGKYAGLNNKTICQFLMEDGQVAQLEVYTDGKTDIYYPFITQPLPKQVLQEYAGSYCCEAISTTFDVTVEENRLLMLNNNKVNTGIDFYWDAIIQDHFIAQYPPYCPWFIIEFKRDIKGRVVSFVMRDDEPSMRENIVFVRRA